MAVPYVQLPYDPAKKSLGDLAAIRLVLDYADSTEHAVHDVYPEVLGNCWRYDRAYGTLKGRAGNISMPEAKEMLQSVSQDHTMWSAIYGLKSDEVQIVPGRKYSTAHKFRL